MAESMEKFLELVKNDEAVQKKLQAAVDSYTGEQTEEAAFTSIMIPLAEEYGFKISYDEFQQVKEQKIKEYTPDEMDQIAGGDVEVEGGGIGLVDCTGFGSGFGLAAGKNGGGVCIVIGAGKGKQMCLFAGI